MSSTRVDRQIALALGAISLALYLRTVAPDLLGGDSGEFQFAAWRLGLAHPTGYPLYLLLGSGWQHLLALFGISPATSLNWMSALLGAVAVSLLCLLLIRMLPGDPITRRIAAAFGAFTFATNLTFWSQSLIAEVYTLHICFVIGILWVAQSLTGPHPLEPNGKSTPIRPQPLILLAFLLGLSLAHHGMTLLLMPPLALYLWMVDRHWYRQSIRTWLLLALAFVLPLLLYLYVPLRSGPEASPWYHQPLGETTLTLYTNDWSTWLNFITGRSISVGFRSLGDALAQIGQAAWLWHYHFGWPGLLLMGLGIYTLVRQANYRVLTLTVGYALLQQVFNLFYNIGDILVYYIPLYLVGAIWIAYGMAGIGIGFRRFQENQTRDASVSSQASSSSQTPPQAMVAIQLFLILLFILPLRAIPETVALLDQSESHNARQQWENILAAIANLPESDAILVSNDRNEIVPLFYLQAVEGRAPNVTGLFPRIAPDSRFADIGATLESALDATAPQEDHTLVYVLKEMPGLEVKFDLDPGPSPLVGVTGTHASNEHPPEHPLDAPLGPLILLGYDWHENDTNIQLWLYWQVDAPMNADYTTTVQLFDTNTGNGEETKLAQSDRQPGGVYYPTSLWKPGEILIEEHTLERVDSATMLIGMYHGPDFAQLATPLEIPLQ